MHIISLANYPQTNGEFPCSSLAYVVWKFFCLSNSERCLAVVENSCSQMSNLPPVLRYRQMWVSFSLKYCHISTGETKVCMYGFTPPMVAMIHDNIFFLKQEERSSFTRLWASALQNKRAWQILSAQQEHCLHLGYGKYRCKENSCSPKYFAIYLKTHQKKGMNHLEYSQE